MDYPKMFRCDRRSMTLSVPACASLWRSAQAKRPEPWEGKFACRTCPVGAQHAGCAMPQEVEATEALRLVCPRCERDASRLIRSRLCISCYNREQEVIRGRNAKGGTPRLSGRLHTERLSVVEPGGGTRIVRRENVIGASEAIIALAKTAKGGMAFGLRRVAFTPQLELIPGCREAQKRRKPDRRPAPTLPQLELGL